jgi:type I restriction enzyme S subunit
LWWFNQNLVKQIVVSTAVGATMPSINTTILSDIPIVLPPIDVLETFNNRAYYLLDIVFDNNKEIRLLEETSDTILVRLAKAEI